MSFESKFASFIRRGGSGQIDLALADLAVLDRKFDVAPQYLLGSIADNALGEALREINIWLPPNTSVDFTKTDLTDIQNDLNDTVAARLSGAGMPVDPNDPVIAAALHYATAQIIARLSQDVLGLTEYIWQSRDDDQVRPAHRARDGDVFQWVSPPPGGNPGFDYGCRCVAEPVFTNAPFPEGATCEKLNAEALSAVFPGASEERRKELAEAIDAVITLGKLDSRDRLIHFLGQAAIEMGPSALAKEDLYYSVEALQKDDYYESHPDEALKFGYIKDKDGNFTQWPNEEAIASRKYAGVNGNGDIASGDGWRFAGRGFLHLTGRDNYNLVTKLHTKVFGEFVDFERHPEYLEEPKYAARSAVLFWLYHELPEIADQGLSASVADKVTKKINRWTPSYKDRSHQVALLANATELQGICQFSVAQPSFGGT